MGEPDPLTTNKANKRMQGKFLFYKRVLAAAGLFNIAVNDFVFKKSAQYNWVLHLTCLLNDMTVTQ